MFGFNKHPKDDSAARLRMLMAERDINTQELAYMTGLNRATISNIRTGRVKKPNSDTIHLVADALGVKPNSIWRDA